MYPPDRRRGETSTVPTAATHETGVEDGQVAGLEGPDLTGADRPGDVPGPVPLHDVQRGRLIVGDADPFVDQRVQGALPSGVFLVGNLSDEP